ncbi:MAG: hypothetical protein D1H97_13560 [Paracoccus sp. BP8]|nr:MAG: hypothetical protein D1H97_13560 [Paracoccus sp. BP8]
MAAEAGLELPIGLTEQKFLQQLARIEARSIKAAQRAEAAFKSSNKASERSFQALERSAGRSLRGMQQLFRVGSGLLAGGVAAQQVRQYMRLADAATQMQNSLRVAGLEGAELSRVYDQLFRSAQRNSAPINSLVDLYSKLALTQKELGVTGDDLIRFTDGIAVALKVAGTDAVSASGSLLQLSQALGGGVVRAEEFNSILEGTPTIAQAVARGLKEANGSVAELRKLVVDGQVSSTAFFRAFEAGSGELRRQAETSQTTVGQAFTRLGNSLVTVVGEFDKATGASAALAEGISSLGSGLDRFDAEGFVSRIQSIADAIRDADEAGTAWLNNLGNAQIFADLNEALGINDDGQTLNPDVREAERKIAALEDEVGTLQARIELNTELGFDNSEAMARLREVRNELAALRAEAANMPRHSYGANMDTGTFIGLDGYTPPPSAPSVEPVSIADHPAAPGKGGSKGRKKGGSGGRSRKEQLDDYAKEVKAIRERTAALEAEAASLLLVAASGEDYGDALEYARKRAELLHAAQKAGKQITPELSAEIDQLAQSYVTAGLNAEQAAEKLDQIKGATERGKNALEDMFGSIIDGSASAKDAVASLLAEIAKAQIVKGILGLPGMGSLSSAIGGLLSFDGGGFTGHGSRSGGIDGRGGFPAILHPNETVIDHTRGQVGSAPKITINNNAPGAVVSADYVTKDEVILTVSQAIASSNRRQSDQKYLARGGR